MPQPERVADFLGVVFDGDWRERAYCRDSGPGVFYACEEKRPASMTREAAIARAKSICRRCPVVSSCLVWAVAHPNEMGVWGGASPEEREAIRRRLRRIRVRSDGYGDDVSLQAV
jgi:WhiB family redox-sensing transcriptional regulator